VGVRDGPHQELIEPGACSAGNQETTRRRLTRTEVVVVLGRSRWYAGVGSLVAVVAAACGSGDATTRTERAGASGGPAPAIDPIPVDCSQLDQGSRAIVTSQELVFDGTVTAISPQRNREAEFRRGFLDDGQEDPGAPPPDEAALDDAAAGEIWPWTAFEVHGWYTTDFGPAITIWTAGLDLEVGDRWLVAGEAFAAPGYVDATLVQSGMAVVCASERWTVGTADTWSQWFGGTVAPGGTEPEGEPDPALVADIEAGRARWRQAAPGTYTATIDVQDGDDGPHTECPARGSVRVTVTDGAPTSAVNLQQGCRIDLDATEVTTIDDLFDLAVTASGAAGERGVTIDPTWGYPASFFGYDRAVELEGAVTTFTSGPSTTLIGDEITTGLDERRDRWAAAGIEDYRFVLDWQCFCIGGTGPIELTVTDGAPTAASWLDPGSVEAEEIPPEVPRTIDAVFDLVEAETPASDLVVATFDDQLGHPSTVYFDRLRNAVDDELTIVISDLQPAGG
jgi:hypothetical protein